MRFKSARGARACAGFTLIEALVALAITAFLMTSIGLLMAENAHGSRRIAQHLGLIATLRLVETGLPDRATLAKGSLSGELQGLNWTVDLAPYATPFINARAERSWTPQLVVITVQSPAGGMLQLHTIRLTGKPAGPGQ